MRYHSRRHLRRTHLRSFEAYCVAVKSWVIIPGSALSDGEVHSSNPAPKRGSWRFRLASAVMPLEIHNWTETDDGLQGKMVFREFDRELTVWLEEGENKDYAEKCASYLNNLSAELLEKLWCACIRYCNDFLGMIGEDPVHFVKPRDVKQKIYPSVLIVPCSAPDQQPVIHMELNCEWEIEHGMEWVVRDDKILYVGGFNGEDPFENFDEKEDWNYA